MLTLPKIKKHVTKRQICTNEECTCQQGESQPVHDNDIHSMKREE